MSETIIDLLEAVVKQAWQEEQAFHKAIFKRELEETHSICQGLSRNIYHKIIGVFPESFMAEFQVMGKSHIVVYVSHELSNYVIDGTIKQFMQGEERNVFLLYEYPFRAELQSAKRWLL